MALQEKIDRAIRQLKADLFEALRGASIVELQGALSGNAEPSERPKRQWPKCKQPGCENNAWAQGKGYCGGCFKSFWAEEEHKFGHES